MDNNRIWRSSMYDILLVSLIILEFILKLMLIASAYWLPIPVTVFLVTALILLNCMNYECASHYFIHRPFFRAQGLNSAFAILNSLALGFPQTLYRAEHLNHHRYGNDHKDAQTGTTGDDSSIYRHGADGQPEPLWRYAALSPLRQDALKYARLTPPRLRMQLAVESVAVGVFWIGALIASWQAFLLLLFVSWAGSAASHLQNWAKHAHADPGSRLTDSVSSYGRLYNLLWFNNGYHQEHHYSPATHWTDLPRLRGAMLPEEQRRVVPHAHLWNLVGTRGVSTSES